MLQTNSERPSALRAAAVLWAALACWGCRDLARDPNYCEDCRGDAAGIVATPGGGTTSRVDGVSTAAVGGGIGNASGVGGAGSRAPATGAGAGTGTGSAGVAGARNTAGTAGTAPTAGHSSPTTNAGSGPAPHDAGAPDASLPLPMDASVDMPPDASVIDPPNACGSICPALVPVCDAVKGSCVQCSASDKRACVSPMQPACDDEHNACVQCTAQDTRACDALGLFCDPASHTCVPCHSSRPESCPSPTQHMCDDTKHTCVECSTSTLDSCPQDRSVCQQSNGTCVQCMRNTDCPMSGTPVCNSNTYSCEGCSFDEDCLAHAGTRCDVTTRACVIPAPAATVELCESCNINGVNPCGAEAACGLPTNLGASSSTVCLPLIQNGACRKAGYSTLNTATQLCEPVVSCDAVRTTASDTACRPNATNMPCGRQGMCPTETRQCTYQCKQNLDCPARYQCAFTASSMYPVCVLKL